MWSYSYISSVGNNLTVVGVTLVLLELGVIDTDNLGTGVGGVEDLFVIDGDGLGVADVTGVEYLGVAGVGGLGVIDDLGVEDILPVPKISFSKLYDNSSGVICEPISDVIG